MNIPSSTLLPSSAFRHISVMVLFMSILMGFASFSLIAVSTIIKGWTNDVENTLSIEIPAFDTETETVLTQEIVEESAKKIITYLENDPTVMRVEKFAPEGIKAIDERFDIPAPFFMTVFLHPRHANNTEERLIKNLERLVPTIIIKTSEHWTRDLHTTISTLRFVFLGLGLSVLVVTTFIITGVVRTQLKASMDTLSLLHLMGASSTTIADLFQRAVTKSVTKGCIPGLVALGFTISPLVSLLDYQGSIILFLLTLPIILLSFAVLSYLTTGLTVSSALREMP